MSYQACNHLTTDKAAFSPSMADEVIPPEYPEPSPAGNNPAICGCDPVSESRGMRTAADERVSTPTTTASLVRYPFIFRSNFIKPCRNRDDIDSGNQKCKGDEIKPGR